MQPFFIFIMEQLTVIITAGGIGKRMGASIPKQFLEIAGKPILMHSFQPFENYSNQVQILLTLPSEWISFWKDLCVKYDFNIPHVVVDGGTERYHSVKNALKIAKGELIAIHDGVRPFVSIELIKNLIVGAKKNGSAVPVVTLKESLRFLNEDGSSNAVDRNQFKSVQTPQVFQKEIIQKAYELPFHSKITDDASLVEETGKSIYLVEGDENNLKITTPKDVWIAEYLFQSTQ
jgi:2-C-methyl-D-erythritol 4-phosphate cytidylyltransferase